MSSSTDVVARLKAEGNALFVNKQYDQAIAKYSQAIERDRSNAILFANRAACYQANKRFAKAEADAYRATQLDRTYAKGWARLATAQNALSQNMNALASWRCALAALPSDDLSPGDLVQKQQYEASVRALEERMREPSQRFTPTTNSVGSPGVVQISFPKGGAPWEKAESLEPSIEGQGIVRSSVFTVLDAHESFSLGQKNMLVLKPVKSRASLVKFTGHPGVIERLSNAVLTDGRVFYVSSEWLEKYSLQVQFELSVRKAPDPAQPMSSYIAHARRLKAEGGWDALRPAISVGVRSAIISAFTESEALLNDVQAVAILDTVLEILRWGRAEWPDAHPDDRGAVFKDTFIRGVRTMRLDRYMRALQSVGDRDAKNRLSFDHVREEANAILEDVLRHPDPSNRKYKGFSIAFFDIPEAMALIAKGFCFMQDGLSHVFNKDGNEADGLLKFRQAHEFYSQGADKYPTDDERRLYFLTVSLIALFRSEAPLKETLPYIAHVREARDAAKTVWEFFPTFQESSATADDCIKFEKEMLQEIEAGRITMNDSRCPSWATAAAAEHSQL